MGHVDICSGSYSVILLFCYPGLAEEKLHWSGLLVLVYLREIFDALGHFAD